MTARPLDVLCVSGSPRHPSRTAALTAAIAAALRERGARCRFWDLAERPVLGGAVTRAHDAADGRELARAAVAADAVVLASPVYHNSCSGLMKAALDELDDELRRKPVALASCAASARCPHAVDHLRLVARALGALVLPVQVVSCAFDHAGREAGYRLRDGAVVERVVAVADELVWLAGLIALQRPAPAREARAAARTLEPIS